MDGTILNKKYDLVERVKALEEGGGGGLPDYSTEEQKIGQKWIDGKSLYQKTFFFEGSYADQITNLPISLDNPDHAFIVSANCLNQNNDIIPLPYVNKDTEANVGIFLNSAMNNIGLRIAGTTTCKNVYITIQYTKTT